MTNEVCGTVLKTTEITNTHVLHVCLCDLDGDVFTVGALGQVELCNQHDSLLRVKLASLTGMGVMLYHKDKNGDVVPVEFTCSCSKRI